MTSNPSLETLQYYRDVHSDKFGWVKAPIRVVEDACNAIESLQSRLDKAEAERDALRETAARAEPYVEICHSIMTSKDNRANVWSALKALRAALGREGA